MDSQEIFNKITDHLARQKWPAINVVAESCALRGYEGTKCAVGCLIPDGEYVPEMEDDSSVNVYVDREELDGCLHAWLRRTLAPTQDQYALLAQLQRCHDSSNSLDPSDTVLTQWPFRLEHIAQGFGLVFDRAAFEKNLNDPSYT